MNGPAYRHLPHLDVPGVTQFITWRCADALPQDVARAIQEATDHLPVSERWKERARRIEAEMDMGNGGCPLHPSRQGGVMKDVLQRFDGELYNLHAWVIMPNRVHVLLTVDKGTTLPKVLNRIKGVSAREINLQRGASGTLWQPESFDRIARDEDHASRIAEYIHYNPVKAKLVASAEAWPLSSAKGLRLSRIREHRAEYGEEFDPFAD